MPHSNVMLGFSCPISNLCEIWNSFFKRIMSAAFSRMERPQAFSFKKCVNIRIVIYTILSCAFGLFSYSGHTYSCFLVRSIVIRFFIMWHMSNCLIFYVKFSFETISL